MVKKNKKSPTRKKLAVFLNDIRKDFPPTSDRLILSAYRRLIERYRECISYPDFSIIYKKWSNSDKVAEQILKAPKQKTPRDNGNLRYRKPRGPGRDWQTLRDAEEIILYTDNVLKRYGSQLDKAGLYSTLAEHFKRMVAHQDSFEMIMRWHKDCGHTVEDIKLIFYCLETFRKTLDIIDNDTPLEGKKARTLAFFLSRFSPFHPYPKTVPLPRSNKRLTQANIIRHLKICTDKIANNEKPSEIEKFTYAACIYAMICGMLDIEQECRKEVEIKAIKEIRQVCSRQAVFHRR